MAATKNYPKVNGPGRPKAVRIWRRIVLPYPLFVFSLLAAGVMLAGWTAVVTGVDISVFATVPAQTLSQPAVIETPVNGAVITSLPTNVSGICPLNSYVEIFYNNIFSGTTLCSANGTFQLATNLDKGQNTLQAKDFNFTDQEGPQSPSINVTYSPPSLPISSTTNTTATSQPSAVQKLPTFALDTANKFQYNGYYVGQQVALRLTAGGGTPPYKFTVDWGDNDPTVTRNKDGEFTVYHTYKQPGQYHGSHIIKVSGVDAIGRTSFLQLFVIINAKSDINGQTTSVIKPITSCQTNGSAIRSFFSCFSQSSAGHWLFVAWPAYITVLLMAISYRLGEREELLVLSNRLRRFRQKST